MQDTEMRNAKERKQAIQKKNSDSAGQITLFLPYKLRLVFSVIPLLHSTLSQHMLCLDHRYVPCCFLYFFPTFF